MSIYDKPTKSLMLEFVKAKLQKGQSFTKDDAVKWFAANYPKINPTTVRVHVEGMSINSRSRKHHPSIKPGSGHDLFFKLGPDQYRLWDKSSDPEPIYKTTIFDDGSISETSQEVDDQSEEEQSGKEFAFERDLRNYLAKNLSLIEPGLRVYEEEEISGIEFPVGGRFIDILAVDGLGRYVVIELKVSRGYDRAVGQLLRYMGWVDANLAAGKKVRGVIVASQISEDLKLAASRVSDVELLEYQIALTIKPVTGR